VSPAGKVSTSVIVPEVATSPVLATESVYEPCWPTVKSPTCDFVSASAGAADAGRMPPTSTTAQRTKNDMNQASGRRRKTLIEKLRGGFQTRQSPF